MVAASRQRSLLLDTRQCCGFATNATKSIEAAPQVMRDFGLVMKLQSKRVTWLRRTSFALLCLLLFFTACGYEVAAGPPACCNGTFCPMHQHDSAQMNEMGGGMMDCQHNMGDMVNCPGSCCHTDAHPLVTPNLFVLPHIMHSTHISLVEFRAAVSLPFEPMRADRPSTPPPRISSL
jgi:hypothetical protein